MLSACRRLSIPRSSRREAGLSNQDYAAPKMGKLIFATVLCAIAVSVLLWLALSLTNLLPVGMHDMKPHDRERRPPKNEQLVLMDVSSVSNGAAESEPLDELLPYLYSQNSQYCCSNLLPQDESATSDN